MANRILIPNDPEAPRGAPRKISCTRAHALMSPFVDSMVKAGEAEQLESHVATCGACQRQLQGIRSVKNVMYSAPEPAVPTGLPLQLRIRLSHERVPGHFWLVFQRLETWISNSIQPVAVPALAGVCLTLLLFGVLLDNIAGYREVQVTGPALASIDRYSPPDLSQAVMVDLYVDERGKVRQYAVLSGPENSPEVDQWIQDVLSFVKFKPATLFGQPVMSRLIMYLPGTAIGVGVI